MSTTARSRGCRCRCWPAPVSPRPSPMLLRESREKPGPPTAPSTLFPSVDSEKGLPGRAGEPPLTGGDRVSGTLCARVQRGARPREQGRGRGSGAGAAGREHESAPAPAPRSAPVGAGGGPRQCGALLRPRLLSAVVARSQQFTELTPSSCHPLLPDENHLCNTNTQLKTDMHCVVVIRPDASRRPTHILSVETIDRANPPNSRAARLTFNVRMEFQTLTTFSSRTERKSMDMVFCE